jgi:hypothetical protein
MVEESVKAGFSGAGLPAGDICRVVPDS